MKYVNAKRLGMAMLVGAALGSGGTVLADSNGAGHAEFLQKFDTNHDGKLDDAERQAMQAQFAQKREEHKQQMLKQYDANGNGQLDPDERKKMHDERSAEHFKKLDTNNDGVLSLQEFQAGQGKFGHHRGHAE